MKRPISEVTAIENRIFNGTIPQAVKYTAQGPPLKSFISVLCNNRADDWVFHEDTLG